MTPQERQLMAELFNRLAAIENSPRDPDAEAMIREGMRLAPNAAYALVQTVLVQDEALKAANNHIQELEQGGGGPQQQEPPRSFLDSMRDSLLGREAPRGSVPRVPSGGAPGGSPWGQQQGYQQPGYQQPGYQQPGYQPGYQGGAPMQAPQGGGGSFLGTAAAAAAGMIGSSLLMGGIRSAMAGHQGGGPAARAFDGLGGDRTASGNAADSDLARGLGVNDIGGRSGSGAGAGDSKRAGLLDSSNDSNDSDDGDDSDDSGDDDSDSDSDTA